MQRCKSSLLLLVVALFALAQTASSQKSLAFRIGNKLACLCGTCNNTVADCPMLECHFAKPARDRIAKLVAEGMPENQIVDEFKRDYGLQILAAPPAQGFNLLGYIMPFIAIALGLMAIWLFIKRFRKIPAAASGPPSEDPALSRYKEQIEKDLSKLDQ